MTIIELKAEAYDIVAQIQHLERRLAEVNKEIGVLSTQKNTEVAPAPAATD